MKGIWSYVYLALDQKKPEEYISNNRFMLHVLHQREKPLQSDIEKAVRSAMLISVKDYICPFQEKRLSLS